MAEKLSASCAVGLTAVFDFADVSDLAVDLNPAGAGIGLSGSDVIDWDSEVGAASFTSVANDPSFVAEYAPLGGKPAVFFDASNSESLLYDAADMAADDYTIFVVLDMQSTSSQYLCDANRGGSGRMILTPATPNIPANPGVGYYDGQWDGAGGAGQTGAQLLTWRLESGSGNASVRMDGADISTGHTYSQRALFGDDGGACRLGASNGGGSWLDAYVGRLIAYQRALTSEEVASVEGALTALYL